VNQLRRPWLSTALRHTMTSAAVIVMVALTATGCAGSHRSPAGANPAQSRSTSPSAGVSATPVISTPASSTRSTSPRPASCRAAQLSASVGESGPAAGTEGIVILLRNTSSRPCWLSGILPLSGVRSTGSVTRLRFYGSTDPAVVSFPTGEGPGSLQPRRYGAFLVTECLTAGTKCATAPTQYVTLQIQLPGNLFISMPYPGVFKLGTPGTETAAELVPAPTGILGH